MLEQVSEFTFWEWVSIGLATLFTILFGAFVYFTRNDFPVYEIGSDNKSSTPTDNRLKGLKHLILISLSIVIVLLIILYFSQEKSTVNSKVDNEVKTEIESKAKNAKGSTSSHEPILLSNGLFEDGNMWE